MNGTDFLYSPPATSPPETVISAFGGAIYVISNSFLFIRNCCFFFFNDLVVSSTELPFIFEPNSSNSLYMVRGLIN